MHAHVKHVSVLQSYCNPSSTYVDTTGNVPSVKDRFPLDSSYAYQPWAVHAVHLSTYATPVGDPHTYPTSLPPTIEVTTGFPTATQGLVSDRYPLMHRTG